MKKIYFAGSIRGGRDDAESYKQIIDCIVATGSTALTEHIGLESLTASGEQKKEQWIYDRDMAWLAEADAVVAEVTNPSLGVGYEIAKAESDGKQVLCLFRNSPDRKLSAMLAGSPNLTIVHYDKLDEAFAAVQKFTAEL